MRMYVYVHAQFQVRTHTIALFVCACVCAVLPPPLLLLLPSFHVHRGGRQQEMSHASTMPTAAKAASSVVAGSSASSIPFTDRYRILGQIGEGSYGLVYKAEDTLQPDRYVAIKKYKHSGEQTGVHINAIREVSLLQELNSHFILRVHDVSCNMADMTVSVVFEYAEYDLLSLIRWHHDRKQPMREEMIAVIMWQLLTGVHYLHSNWILHRDLKPANILVFGDGHLCIADFGLARSFRQPLQPLSHDGVVVTVWYRAPELLLGAKHYTRAVDLWAVGCIMAELFNSQALFMGEERKRADAFQDDQVKKIFAVLGMPDQQQWPDIIHLPHYNSQVRLWNHQAFESARNYSNRKPPPQLLRSDASAHAQDLVQKLLQYDPNKRITASDALQHPWFTAQPSAAGNRASIFLSSNGVYPMRVLKNTQHPTPQVVKHATGQQQQQQQQQHRSHNLSGNKHTSSLPEPMQPLSQRQRRQ